MIDLSVKIGELELKTPIVLASGTCGYGIELKGITDFSAVGAITIKGVSLTPKEGNPPPRIFETPCGVLNRIGLENPGIEKVLELMPEMRKPGVPLIANLHAETVDDFKKLAALCMDFDAIELNLSCPNVKEGGIVWGKDPSLAGRVTGEVRKVTKKTLIVKLTPNTDRLEDVALACEEAGADALSLVNTYQGMEIDLDTWEAWRGGLSGPAIRPLALFAVRRVYEKVKIPLIGMGGIKDENDAIKFFLAGASAIGLGSIMLRDPEAPRRVLSGIIKYLKERNLHGIKDIKGRLRWKD